MSMINKIKCFISHNWTTQQDLGAGKSRRFCKRCGKEQYFINLL